MYLPTHVKSIHASILIDVAIHDDTCDFEMVFIHASILIDVAIHDDAGICCAPCLGFSVHCGKW